MPVFILGVAVVLGATRINSSLSLPDQVRLIGFDLRGHQRPLPTLPTRTESPPQDKCYEVPGFTPNICSTTIQNPGPIAPTGFSLLVRFIPNHCCGAVPLLPPPSKNRSCNTSSMLTKVRGEGQNERSLPRRPAANHLGDRRDRYRRYPVSNQRGHTGECREWQQDEAACEIGWFGCHSGDRVRRNVVCHHASTQ